MTDASILEMVDELPPDDTPIPGLHDENYCVVCDRTFDTLGGLRRHNTRIHGSSDKPPKQSRTARPPLKPALVNTLGVVSFGLMVFNQPADAMIVADHADHFAEAWAKLAQRNPKVDRILRSLTNATEYGEVIAATLGMAIPIMVNHGLLPDQFTAMFAASAKLNEDARSA